MTIADWINQIEVSVISDNISQGLADCDLGVAEVDALLELHQPPKRKAILEDARSEFLHWKEHLVHLPDPDQKANLHSLIASLKAQLGGL